MDPFLARTSWCDRAAALLAVIKDVLASDSDQINHWIFAGDWGSIRNSGCFAVIACRRLSINRTCPKPRVEDEEESWKGEKWSDSIRPA